MKHTVEEHTDRTVKILEGKIKEVIEKGKQEATKEAMWLGAFDLLKESLNSTGMYAEESLVLANKYAPETLGESANEVRECLTRMAHASKDKAWENRGFCQLMLKTVFTPEAYADADLVDRVIDQCTCKMPKSRKRALSVLRRIVEHENTTYGESKTFDKIIKTVEALADKDIEYAGRIISILGQLKQEIAMYNSTEKMLRIVQRMQAASPNASIPVLTFAESLLLDAPLQHIDLHVALIESAAGKGCQTSESLSILLKYLALVAKSSSVRSMQTGEPFFVEAEGSSFELSIKELVSEAIEKAKPARIDVSLCEAVHSLMVALNERAFPAFKRVVLVLAQYCFNEKDLRMAKCVELMIGAIGLDQFMKAVKEHEFFFWLPMIRSGVHSEDIEVFMRRFMPEISVTCRTEKKAEYEALWACFPSFCRGMKDERGLFGKLMEKLPFHLSNPSVRGYISQGISVLVEESYREMERNPSAIPFRTALLSTLSNAIDLFERLLQKFKLEQTENDREGLRSLIKVLDADWLRKYYAEIVESAFLQTEEMYSGELRPDLNRKETDVPEHERVFINNAPLLEVSAHMFVGNAQVTMGVLKYVMSTHLRTQKMAYKVLLGLIHGGFCPASLIDFFMDPRADAVLFQCSRHLKLQVMHELVKKHNVQEGPVMCRLLFEIIRAVRTEGGRNRKVAFDITNEIAVAYPAPVFAEICKMAAAGIPSGNSDYQAGGIVVLSSLFYQGRDNVTVEILDMAFDIVDRLSTEKKYAVAKGSIGFLSVLLIELGHMDRYLEKALVCLDRIIFHFKAKLHENIKLILRKIVERRGVSVLTCPQSALLDYKIGRSRHTEEERIVTDASGKMRIKEQKIVKTTGKKRVKR
ncbi:uncharacterized protein NEMAJ01_0411 [Nematocida major]|uniref:uncharacterized protein n=1 Tax=Nematocida major TaxID=1912982 RepID=UPI002008DA32|nr:uncharacterized protein NEMAJ01_0411 [Nematocida major]KAH9385515.1 hypothetical protein NEMAJ01_0411 [Nematocida major]